MKLRGLKSSASCKRKDSILRFIHGLIVHGFLEVAIKGLERRSFSKYQRTGALFEGPYKSVQIEDEPHLLHLTRYLHHTGGYNSYQDFVEKYGLNQQEKEFLANITFDSEVQHLERRGLASNEEIRLDPDLEPRSRIPEFIATAIIFSLLLTIGITNITISAAKSSQPSPNSAVLSQTANTEEVNPTPADPLKPKVIMTIYLC